MRCADFSFFISRFTLIFHFSFSNGKWLNAKLLKIDNCALKIATLKGVA